VEPAVDRSSWKVDQRVARRDSDELGVVVDVDRSVVKVKWNCGRTSYFRPEMPANVRLADNPLTAPLPEPRDQ
jgi:hypothetical protein